MASFALNVANGLVGALQSATSALFDIVLGSQESTERTTPKQNLAQQRRNTNSHDLHAASIPVPMKRVTDRGVRQRDPENLLDFSSQAAVLDRSLNPGHFESLRRFSSTPNLATTRSPSRSIGPTNATQSYHETPIEPASTTGNPIVPRRKTIETMGTTRAPPRVRFANTKDMQSVTGGRHVGKVTDNEWKGSNKIMMSKKKAERNST